jgi:hypothetical protein
MRRKILNYHRVLLESWAETYREAQLSSTIDPSMFSFGSLSSCFQITALEMFEYTGNIYEPKLLFFCGIKYKHLFHAWNISNYLGVVLLVNCGIKG